MDELVLNPVNLTHSNWVQPLKVELNDVVIFEEVHLNLMRHIKQVFDPQGILNPGKIF